MNLFNLFKDTDIDKSLRKIQNTPGAVLLDVRTFEEHTDAHIPGSLNIPLDKLQSAEKKISDKSTPLFVYCLSGGRSCQAVHFLKHLGYTDVTDLGGIHHYTGQFKKGV